MISRLQLRTSLAAMLLLSAAASHAQEVRKNLVSLSYTSTRELTQDQLQVTLQAVKDGSSAPEVQAQLKQVLDAALIEAKAASKPDLLEVRTGGFSVTPRYNASGRIQGWQGQAQLLIEGTDMGKISQLAGRIAQMNVVGTSFGLSKALRASQEADLTSEAIAGFRARATRISQDFGKKGYSLGEVNVSTADTGWAPRPMAMMARAKTAEAMADAPLPVEPGKAQLSVTVNGQVQLEP